MKLITTSGKHIQITDKRLCAKCSVFTDQVCHKVRYKEHPNRPDFLVKMSYWICPVCLTETEEIKEQRLPGDKVRIINRLLRMQEDYEIQSMNITSAAEKLVVEITVKN